MINEDVSMLTKHLFPVRQCKTIVEDVNTQMMSKLQVIASPEDSLPTWWTNKR